MPDAPDFFVPDVKPEDQERAYADLARRCNSNVPEPGRRVFSITYNHDGEEWTATVGKALRGIKRARHLSDPATVRAIFPGDPFFVVTDEGDPRSRGSRWVNPFMAGKPTSIIYFKAADTPKEPTP